MGDPPEHYEYHTDGGRVWRRAGPADTWEFVGYVPSFVPTPPGPDGLELDTIPKSVASTCDLDSDSSVTWIRHMDP